MLLLVLVNGNNANFLQPSVLSLLLSKLKMYSPQMTVRMMMLKRRSTRTITIAVFCVPGNMERCSRPWRNNPRENVTQIQAKSDQKSGQTWTNKESLGERARSANDGVKAENRCWLEAAAASGGGQRKEEEGEEEEEEGEEERERV